ncbi:hypothetical protein [Sporosarcina sp. FSL W7-1283]|uniref:hypothetical protein n=1 Tax=Sporosarcina sp. FSL W7-1283 TaxID=2921560 RepID=UPI0030FBBB62
MKLNKKNATTDENFAAPFSPLTIAQKHRNDPTINEPNPKTIRSSKDSLKIYEKPINRTPIIANRVDKTLKLLIAVPPLHSLYRIII